MIYASVIGFCATVALLLGYRVWANVLRRRLRRADVPGSGRPSSAAPQEVKVGAPPPQPMAPEREGRPGHPSGAAPHEEWVETSASAGLAAAVEDETSASAGLAAAVKAELRRLEEQLAARQKSVFWITAGLSACLLAASLLIILSRAYEEGAQKWAYATVGTLVGFWLKPAAG